MNIICLKNIYEIIWYEDKLQLENFSPLEQSFRKMKKKSLTCSLMTFVEKSSLTRNLVEISSI